MENLTPISETRNVQHYTNKSQTRPSGSTRSTREPLPSKPLIRRKASPNEIIAKILGVWVVESLFASSLYQAICNHIFNYQKLGAAGKWDEYRAGIAEAALRQLGEIFSECRRQGYLNPRVVGEDKNRKIIWEQIVSRAGIEYDLCTLCDRGCNRRKNIDEGFYHHQGIEEPPACWEKEVGRIGV